MPVPSAWISVPISFDDSMRSKRARSTLRILPFKGRIAWMLRSRPCLAEPPALSPSPRNNLHLVRSRARPPGPLAVDRNQFALGRIAFLAVGELAWQRGDVHHPLAAGQLTRALGR